MIIEINYYATTTNITTTNITTTKHRPPSRPRLVIDTVSIKLRFRMFH